MAGSLALLALWHVDQVLALADQTLATNIGLVVSM
jgi:hypothetical protein